MTGTMNNEGNGASMSKRHGKRYAARFRASAANERTSHAIRAMDDKTRESLAMFHEVAPMIPAGTGSVNGGHKDGLRKRGASLTRPRQPKTTVRTAPMIVWADGIPVAESRVVTYSGTVAHEPAPLRTSREVAPVLQPRVSYAAPFRPLPALFALIDEGCARMDDRTELLGWFRANAWRQG